MRTSPLAASARSTSVLSASSPKPRQKLAMSADTGWVLLADAPALMNSASTVRAGRS
ncbi:hypothetical protein X551_03429 [Methylibium sp. T29]|nr:hypothetical protein X551_03429 [Methylibium sp. T29]EWS58228.1 hypothetical protein Y694_03886 [Methylibium sp. T29-B]